jgi:hypothetical protein
MIGLGVGAAVLVLGVAGYFAFSYVSTIKGETAAAQAESASLQSQDAQVQAQMKAIGVTPANEGLQPAVQSELSQVVSLVQGRPDFTLIMRDLRSVLPNTRTGLSTVTIGAPPQAAGGGSTPTSSSPAAPTTITVEGVAPDAESVNALLSDIDATPTMEDASVTSLQSTQVKGSATPYVSFIVTANLAIGGQGGQAPVTGAQLVSDTPPADVSLDPLPPAPKPKGGPAPKPKPVDPLAGLVSDASNLGGN